MTRLFVMIFVGYILYLMFRGRPAGKEIHEEVSTGEETFKDPVCGVYVTREDAVIGNLEGEKLYFCSMGCLERFSQQLENKAIK